MQRIAGADVAPNGNGTGKAGFQGRLPGVQAATEVTTTWLNDTQEEVCTAVTMSGQTLSARRDQLYNAIHLAHLESALINASTKAPGSAYAGTLAAVHVSRQGSTTVIAVGSSGGIQRSTDGGNTWAAISPAAAYSGSFAAVYETSPGEWIAVGSAGEIQTSSDDGATWTHRTQAAAYAGFFTCIVAPDSARIVIAGSAGEIQTSDDGGVTWVHRTAAAAYAGVFGGGTYGTSKYVLGGTNGEIQTSSDGATWTHRTAAGSYTGSFMSGAGQVTGLFTDEFMVLSGTGGEIQRSTDGITWVSSTSGATEDLFSIFVSICGPNPADYPTLARLVYFAVGANGTVLVSVDATSWRVCSRYSFRLIELYAVSHGVGVDAVVMVGASGTIRKSMVI